MQRKSKNIKFDPENTSRKSHREYTHYIIYTWHHKKIFLKKNNLQPRPNKLISFTR